MRAGLPGLTGSRRWSGSKIFVCNILHQMDGGGGIPRIHGREDAASNRWHHYACA